MSKFLNNNDHDQMGMLAFGDNIVERSSQELKEEPISPRTKPRPLSIIGKLYVSISTFPAECSIFKI